jgi:hypothetical protein
MRKLSPRRKRLALAIESVRVLATKDLDAVAGGVPTSLSDTCGSDNECPSKRYWQC